MAVPSLPRGAVLIGITLGVTAGSAFDTLLVALAFHQFFEGFAIGSAVVDSGLGVGKSLIAGLAYSITTPTGIAIGERGREGGQAAAGAAGHSLGAVWRWWGGA